MQGGTLTPITWVLLDALWIVDRVEVSMVSWAVGVLKHPGSSTRDVHHAGAGSYVFASWAILQLIFPMENPQQTWGIKGIYNIL